MGDIVLKRKINPIGYWLMTSIWLLIALGIAAGILYLTYMAVTSSGPYKAHAFFSMHQVWPYAATALVFGFLALKIIRRRLFFFWHGRGAA
ncbi:hypothetical protein [Arenimonas oryziterrae]|uniref:Uncharacterized protein n=1 Tax=Arenimonas oryziterrae DSM 21050 = YC6267 TaxID=1121015 RepID=A0A091AQD0_9GAMM|nr:hypothetical protein [Arenimonas oryziterrae]KFN41347.1 hypothetical protein N789_05590 [Arenimonas oryziterrae DSM 21050 = YC6267]